MADHDDKRVPPADRSFYDATYPEDRRYITAREHEQLRKRVHDVANDVNAAIGRQHTEIAVLQRDVDSHGEQLKTHASALLDMERGKNREHEEIRREINAASLDARKYAAVLVSDFRKEVLEMRREEKEERRQETNSAIARAAIWVGLATGLVSTLAAIFVAILK